MSIEQNKESLRRLFEEALNKDDQRVIDELIAPNYVNYDMPAPRPGPEGFRQVIAMFRNAFPDMRISVDDVLAEGDRVTSRGVMAGTHQGEFMGIKPTGKTVKVKYQDMWRIENGKFVENWVQLDMLGMMQQLGSIPDPGPARPESSVRSGPQRREERAGGYSESPEENKALVREAMQEIWSKGNLDVADKAFTADYTAHDPAMPHPVTSPAAFKQFVSMFRSAFPNLHVAIEEQIASGDRVVTRWVARGTHKGELMGVPPTGKDIAIVGLTISRIDRGRIAEDWTNWSTLDMLRQIGSVTPSAGKGI